MNIDQKGIFIISNRSHLTCLHQCMGMKVPASSNTRAIDETAGNHNSVEKWFAF